MINSLRARFACSRALGMVTGLLQLELLMEVVGLCQTQEETRVPWVMPLGVHGGSRVDKNPVPWFLHWMCLDAFSHGATLPRTAEKVREGQGTPAGSQPQLVPRPQLLSSTTQLLTPCHSKYAQGSHFVYQPRLTRSGCWRRAGLAL